LAIDWGDLEEQVRLPRAGIATYAMSSQFSVCFPGRDGVSMVCRHINGSWIVFPLKANSSSKR